MPFMRLQKVRVMMCEPASFVITQPSILWSEKSDSHSDILKENGIVDSSKSPDFVKVELCAPDGDMSYPLKDWKFFVDQSYRPEWFNATAEELRVREELEKWYSCKVDVGKHFERLKGHMNKYLVDCTVDVLDLTCGNVRFFGTSTCNNNNPTGGSVNFLDNSTCNNNNPTGGYVNFYHASTCTNNNPTGGSVYFKGN